LLWCTAIFRNVSSASPSSPPGAWSRATGSHTACTATPGFSIIVVVQ
jgi:hypothetical protein